MSQPPLSGDETVIAPGTRFETVGDFEIISKLGQGGMGAVYRARQKSLDRQVALKILPATLEADADFVSRFQREARVAASLNHANLVKVYASGEADGTHFIAMELIEGETLGDWLKRGALPPLEALRICGDIARALGHGWQRAQLIHRDIKPGNVFLSTAGDVKVGDLGLAKSMGGDTTGLTQTGTAMGTPHYISPEQARGEKDLDFRADIYSLGCTLYQMLTGQTPYSGGDPMSVMLQHINSPPPAILKVWPQCPIPVARLVGKMLKKAKRERHASYEELLQQIESVRALYDPSTATAPPTPPDPDATILQGAPTPRVASATAIAPVAKSKTPLYGAIVAGVVILGVVVFLIWPKEEKLTKAELYAKQREAEQATATSAPGGTRPGASDSTVGEPGRAEARPSEVIAAEPWEPLLSRAKWEAGSTNHEFIDGLARFRGFIFNASPIGDGAVRARFVFRPGGTNVGLVARSRNEEGVYKLRVSESGRAVHLEHAGPGLIRHLKLVEVNLPQPLQDGDRVDLEFRVIGPQLSGFVNGRKVLETRDDQMASPGFWGVQGRDAWFESAAVLPLSAAASVALSSPKSEPWRDTAAPAPRAAPREAVSTTPPPNAQRFRGSSYLVVPTQLSWSEAKDRAEKMGGHLATITSAEEHQWITENLLKGGIHTTWIGGSRDGDGQWKWITGEPFAFAEWEKRNGVATPDPKADKTRLQLSRTSTSPPTACWRNAAETSNWNPFFLVEWDAPVSPAEPWQDVLRDPAQLRRSGGVERTAQGLLFSGNAVAYVTDPNAPKSDGAIRMRTTFGGIRVRLRRMAQNAPIYQVLVVDEKQINLARRDEKTMTTTSLRDFALPKPLKVGEDYELELRFVGRTISVKLNGTLLGSLTDEIEPRGNFDAAAVNETSTTPTLVKSLEVLNLDAPAAEPWQDAVRNPGLLEPGPAESTADGLRLPDKLTVKAKAAPRDGAVRIRTAFSSARTVSLRARYRPGGASAYFLAVRNRVELKREEAGKVVTLAEYPLPKPIAEGGEYEAELRVVGAEIIARVNGTEVGRFTDPNPFMDGAFGATNYTGAPAVLKTLQFLDLTPGTTASAPAAEPWQDVLVTPGRLQLFGTATSTSEGLKLPPESGALVEGSASRSDAAITMTTTFHRGVRGPGLRVRAERGELTRVPRYVLNYQENNEFWLSRLGAGPDVPLARYAAPDTLRDGEDYTLELRAVGSRLTVKLNNEILGEVVDSELKTGSVGVSTGNRLPAPALIKKLAYLPLEPALINGPAAATKDAPFVNSLGMKFVPVPITGGPTNGQRVLFSIWETRVQDYEAFCQASGRKRTTYDVDPPQSPEHPVMRVSWTDAGEFCQWLTAREREAGRLAADQLYRLPSDHEWSCAAGIGEREEPGQPPDKKHLGIAGIYPWGTQWPLSAPIENLSGEEGAERAAARKQKVIAGYRDAFEFTSPVGSFAPNVFGLYDLGGNLAEWCGDWPEADRNRRVSRGGSWFATSSEGAARSSYRHFDLFSEGKGYIGFRVVLAPVP